MPPRKTTKTSTPVQSIKHKDKRANIPTEGLRDFVSPELLERLQQAKILIADFHAFQLREKIAAGRLTNASSRDNLRLMEGPELVTPYQAL
jgi:hypothetical protein